jgi:hypothetical protein
MRTAIFPNQSGFTTAVKGVEQHGDVASSLSHPMDGEETHGLISV